MLEKYVALLQLLDKSFTERDELNYFLNQGTLLGAIRHGYFIPWDVEVDIVVFGTARSIPQLNSVLQSFRRLASSIFTNASFVNIETIGPDMRRITSGMREYPISMALLPGIKLYGTTCGIVRLSDYWAMFPMTDLLPPRTCGFHGVMVRCPRQAVSVLHHLYGPDWVDWARD